MEGGGKAFDEWDCTQIVQVIEDEAGDYKKFGPKTTIFAGRFAIFALPREAKVCNAKLLVMSPASLVSRCDPPHLSPVLPPQT